MRRRMPYNEHHFFNANLLKRFSLGTKNKSLQTNSDGSLTLICGGEVSRQRQGDELASRSEHAVLAVYPLLLAEAGSHQRYLKVVRV